MSSQEMKQVLAKGVMSMADIKKPQCRFDAEKISGIVEGSLSPREAFEALHEFYPELETERLKKQCEFILVQVKYKWPMELCECETEHVSAGGFFSSVGKWFKKNWKAFAVGSGIFVGVLLVITGIGAGIGACITGPLIYGTTTSSGTIVSVYGTMAAGGALIGAVAGAFAGAATTGTLAGTGVLNKVK